MIEIYEPKKIIRPHIEALHGHTTIELQNVKTGRRERIEHDNTFTDGIENFLISGGFFNNAPWSDSDWRGAAAWRRLLGGIFCFQDAIPADGGGNFPTTMPAGNTMIANGSYGIANSGTVTEMGSYNSAESSILNNSITMVYDWLTSQGNGTISTVCLTSDIGGYIGYGNATSNQRLSTLYGAGNQQSANERTHSGNELTVTISTTNNKEYWWSCNDVNAGGTLTVNINKLPINELSVFDIATTKTLTNPASVSLKPLAAPQGKILWLPNILSGSTTYTIYLQDIETGASTSYSFTTPAGSSISAGYNMIIHEEGFHCTFNSINYFYSYATQTTTADGINPGYANKIGAGIYLGYANIYDAVAERTSPVNGYGYNPNTSASYRWSFTTEDGQIYSGWNYPAATGHATKRRNPLYLATVNNLEEAITKTADSTMKITYNITPAA